MFLTNVRVFRAGYWSRVALVLVGIIATVVIVVGIIITTIITRARKLAPFDSPASSLRDSFPPLFGYRPRANEFIETSALRSR